jgi:tripartite-type tricarboxylate transporter receptor subunit TctC
MNFAIIAPKGVPDPIVQKLDDAVARVMKNHRSSRECRSPLSVGYRSGKVLDRSMAQTYEYFKKTFADMG